MKKMKAERQGGLSRPWYLDTGLLPAHELLGWPQIEGCVRWRLIDVRLYPEGRIREGWMRTHARSPIRVYVEDGDDWNVERAFAAEPEAREVLALLATGPVTAEDLAFLGFREA